MRDGVFWGENLRIEAKSQRTRAEIAEDPFTADFCRSMSTQFNLLIYIKRREVVDGGEQGSWTSL
jgi:hypothetical protein